MEKNYLHLYWDTTGRFQGAQELQGSLAVLVGQGDHFCLELQENQGLLWGLGGLLQEFLEVVLLFVDKLDSTLQKESLGWGSPAPDRHR